LEKQCIERRWDLVLSCTLVKVRDDDEDAFLHDFWAWRSKANLSWWHQSFDMRTINQKSLKAVLPK